ncbi:hypothetical protein NDA18_005756 [Ustilago nuda]|nr:hypothetical protein NDA18_005756 [Ustilago nuda]
MSSPTSGPRNRIRQLTDLTVVVIAIRHGSVKLRFTAFGLYYPVFLSLLIPPQSAHCTADSMNSSQVSASALSTLPPVVSEELQSLSRSGELANVMDQLDEDEEFLADVDWPASPPPPQGPLVTSASASTPVSSSQAPQATQNSSLSRSASPSGSQGSTLAGNPQWDPVSMEILAKAVLNRNPNHAPNNSAKASVWEPIYQEYKEACRRKRLPFRELSATKKKWRDMVKKRRGRDQLNARSTGGAEATSVTEKLIDDFIATEGVNTAAASRSLPSTPTPRRRRRFVELPVDRDRQQFAEIASNTGGGDPAARPLTAPSERASQEDSATSESGDDRVDMQARKRPRNTTADVLSSIAEGMEIHRQHERSFRDRQLRFMEESLKAQMELSKAQLNIETRGQTEIQTKMESLDNRMRASQEQTDRLESMVSTMMSMIRSNAAAGPSCGQRHRRSSRSRSSSRTDVYNGFEPSSEQ